MRKRQAKERAVHRAPEADGPRPSARTTPLRALRRTGALLLPLGVLGFAGWGLWRVAVGSWTGPEFDSVILADAGLRGSSMFPPADAHPCARCHRAEYDEWAGSQHASAMRLVDARKDADVFGLRRPFVQGDTTIAGATERNACTLSVSTGNRATVYRPEAVIGIAPLRQYLVPFPGGRLQTLDMAWDPAAKEWFNINGDEQRRPEEWGHWTGRGMNWNSQCAYCHTTGLDKGYDPAADLYRTTWKALGISCSQCHPATEEHLRDPEAKLGALHLEPAKMMQVCASCHARREELTGAFRPGDDFFDHYRPLLADTPGVFYPDGQVRNEDFEYGSFLMSRMWNKNVTCLDCHSPHTGRLVLADDDNTLCTRCHTAPGTNGATVIDEKTHGNHGPGSAGGRCVGCHMPPNTYMARDHRRDHGLTIPDPQLTRLLGIPNACDRCHPNKPSGWAEQLTQEWYGDRMERRSRVRAKAIGALQAGDHAAVAGAVGLLRDEEIAAWRAVLAGSLAPWGAEPTVRAALEGLLKDPHPVVRAAAVRVLGASGGADRSVAALADDPSRLVRLDAVGATIGSIPASPDRYKEYRHYLRETSDQPAGALREAELALAEHRNDDAELWARRAAVWDPSPVGRFQLGQVLHAVGKSAEAIEQTTLAARAEPAPAEFHFALGLMYSQVGRRAEAAASLERAVSAEPGFGRAWYNLGLAYAGLERLPEAVKALEQARVLMPGSPDPTYASATVHLRLGDVGTARAALQESLKIDPAFAPAREALRTLRPRRAGRGGRRSGAIRS